MTERVRTQELEDREAIRRIFADYAGYLDAGDHAGYASLFADDGVMAAQLGEAVGPAAIEATLDAALGPSVRATFPSAVHVMNNQRIDIDGDAATTDVLWFYLTTDDDGVPTILQAGRYTDRLVKRNGEWKLSRHDISRLMGRSPTARRRRRRSTGSSVASRSRGPRGDLAPVPHYKRHLDQRDFKAYASLFTDDVVWAGNLGKAVGPAEIEELLIRTMEVYPSDLERTTTW